MTTAFQRNAFQNNAFQIAGIGGVVGRRRHDREELERRLKAQKENTFGRNWFDRFLRAEEEARRKIAEAKDAELLAALEEAVEGVAARVSEAIDYGLAAPEEIIMALERAAGANKVASSIRLAERTAALASIYADHEDENDTEILLLH